MTHPFAYPLKLRHILEKHPWGGSLMSIHLNLPPGIPGQPRPAVCWGLVVEGGRSSVVDNGPCAGTPLARLVEENPEPLVGLRYRPGTPFPLYARLLSSGEARPLQVHPSASFGGAHENNMLWHLVDALPGCELGVGLGGSQGRYRFSERREDLPFESMLKLYPAYPGDSFFIPAGRIHALRGESLVWEIGQLPAEPLEISASPGAAQAVNFHDQRIARISGEVAVSQSTRRVRILPYCPNFFIDQIRLQDRMHDRTDAAVFCLLVQLSGKTEIRTRDFSETLLPGDVVLLPACLGDYELFAIGGPARLLQATPNILPR